MGDTDRAALDQMRGVVCEDFADVQVIDEDYGFRCLAPDDVPLIGRTKYQNLYLNTGHGSKGWTMGAGSGKLCAQVRKMSCEDWGGGEHCHSNVAYTNFCSSSLACRRTSTRAGMTLSGSRRGKILGCWAAAQNLDKRRSSKTRRNCGE